MSQVTAPHPVPTTMVAVHSDLPALAESRLAAHDTALPGYRALHEMLQDRLGRESLLMPPADPLEPAAYRIMTAHGRSFPPPVRIVAGLPGRCHANVARLYVTGELDCVVSGFCLDAGVWRQHTWGLRAGEVTETTSRREAYFGVELTGPGAALFAFCELGSSLSQLSMSPKYVASASRLRDLLRHARPSESSVWDFLERSGQFVVN